MKLIFKEDEREILLNVTHYSNFKEYEKYNNTDQEEFNDQLELGYIQDITLGTYNGYTNTFTRASFTYENILEALLIEMSESGYYDRVYETCEENNELAELEKMTNIDWAIDFTNCYDVFSIEDQLFIDLG